MAIEIGRLRPDEFARLYEIVAEQNDPEDVHDARATLEGAHARPGDWIVARVDDRLAAIAIVVPMEARIGGIVVPALAPEIVATAKEFTGSGLQRLLFSALAEAYPDRPIHLIEGIPYFYRRLGYEYAIPHPTQQVVERPTTPDGWEVRRATPDDLERIRRLQAATQQGADVAFTHPPHLWHWTMESPLYRVVMATDGGEWSMARGYSDGDDHWVMEVAAESDRGARAAISGAVEGDRVRVYHRPGAPWIADLGGEAVPSGYAYYARVVDLAAVLDMLRPEFEVALARSELTGWSGTFLLSQYASSITSEVMGGRFGRFEVGGPVQAPVSQGGSGVPPDLTAHLLLGPLGARGLAERHPDVLLGKQADLMEVLFPPRTADVHTWVAP
jgi:GNAT superfamily N-acetyltransferase